MKLGIIAASAMSAAMLFSSSVLADTYVDGYTRSDGTYVQGHYRSDRNSTVRDNYSYKGNVNPHTGSTGNNYYRNSPSSGYYGTQPSRSGGYGSSSGDSWSGGGYQSDLGNPGLQY